MDPNVERTFLSVAHALFMNRLHLLRLTEVVRLGIRPDPRVDGCRRALIRPRSGCASNRAP